ncbi:MAG: DNA adenine methylase [Clostridia bacterium]|nr:DNA adenine methylase [Clostridia bacterium]
MERNKMVAPVVKWVGGKRQLLAELTPLFPKKISIYCEPFIGGGAVLFSKQPGTAYINDVNSDLINIYEVIKDNVEELISSLQKHKNESEYFYKIRDFDRNHKEFTKLSNIEKASRMLYLNKTCYNGLYRVNNAGEFNSPFGSYKNPNIVNAPTLRAVNKYFNEAEIYISNVDYSEVLHKIPKESFVYLDPPYDPVSATSNFTGYTKGGFDREEQIRLRECFDQLDDRGIKFMLSNSATDFIKEQYSKYFINTVKAKRAINSVASKRGDIDEVVIRNYE